MEFNIKEKVKEHYGNIAQKVNAGSSCGCCEKSSCCVDSTSPLFLYNNEHLLDIPQEAITASLGCANPLAFAELKPDETVLDLGSGGGIDVFIAAKQVGPKGKVFGIDMTDEMLELARKNQAKMGVQNVEFIKGYIEAIPLPDNSVDVILSNCVINLSEDKKKALSEAYRVLKNGGRLTIADIVILKDVPRALRNQVNLWVGCIAGALTAEEYHHILQTVGFTDISIEPVYFYTRDIIDSLMVNQPEFQRIASEINLDLLDGAFAGAQIKGKK